MNLANGCDFLRHNNCTFQGSDKNAVGDARSGQVSRIRHRRLLLFHTSWNVHRLPVTVDINYLPGFNHLAAAAHLELDSCY